MQRLNIRSSTKVLQSSFRLHQHHVRTIGTIPTSPIPPPPPVGSIINHPSFEQPKGKKAGDISSIFPSLSGHVPPPLPSRFAEVKARILQKSTPAVLQESWDRLLNSLQEEIKVIEQKGSEVIPIVDFKDLRDLQEAHKSGIDDSVVQAIKKRGAFVVQNVIPRDEVLEMKAATRRYIEQNTERVRAFPAPPQTPTVYEIYWSPAQIRARTHPSLYETHKFLLELWGAPTSTVDTSFPLSYADRLRIRPPGDAQFTLGPHMDSGSVERWEDLTYSSVYEKIWAGEWENYDPYGQVEQRGNARMDMYNAPGGCSMLRMWQGWLSLSDTGPGEGTLRVYPLVKHATAYVLLRPFFEAAEGAAGKWKLTHPPTPIFPLSALAASQELSPAAHPHLSVDTAMVSIPQVGPGDYVAWHCDLIHAVETLHNGKGDSSVFYIPAVPKNPHNLRYLRDQKKAMDTGAVPADFPGSGSMEEGSGEIGWVGRGTWEDVHEGDDGRGKASLGWGL